MADKAPDQDFGYVKSGTASWSWLYNVNSPKDYSIMTKYVDFAKEMGWEYVLVDANWNIMKNGTVDDLIDYSEQKNIGLFLWYNSAGAHNPDNTEQPRDIMHNRELRRAEFKKIADKGIKGVKIDFFESDKPNIFKLYEDILKDALEYKIIVNFHGCTLPRGWRRTYPNLITMEAVKGGEMYLFNRDMTNQAGRHNSTLPFTRNVVGPMDYTPCNLAQNNVKHITSDLHELALAVVFESGILHLGDTPESYKNLPPKALMF